MKLSRKKLSAVLLLFVLAACLIPAFSSRGVYALTADEMPHGITVVYNGDVYSQRGITWVAGKSVTDCRVEYIEKTGTLAAQDINWGSAAVNKVSGTYAQTNGTTLRTAYNAYKALVTGLEAGKSYFYRIYSPNSDAASPVGSITVDEKDTGELTFVNITDPQEGSQSGYKNVAKVLRSAVETTPEAKFILCNGDNSNSSHSVPIAVSEWNYFFDESKDVLMNYPLLSLAGNHESIDYAFTDRFHYDYGNKTTASLATGGYYAVEYGNVFFAFLDSNSINDRATFENVQLAWLKNRLATTTAQWKIVSTHKTPVTPGQYYGAGETNYLRTALMPIMAQYKVDIVLQGHNHCYLRSNPYSWDTATGQQPLTTGHSETGTHGGTDITYAVEPGGTSYYMINYSGNKQYGLQDYDPTVVSVPANPVSGGLSAGAPYKPMFSAFSIKDNRLTYKAYTVDRPDNSAVGIATLYDSYGIIKDTDIRVSRLIEALPAVSDITVYDAPQIAEAKTEFDGLIDSARNKVSQVNKQKLNDILDIVDIESAMRVLNAEAAIDNIGSVDLTDEAKARLQAAQYAYNDLNHSEKYLVRNYTVVTAAEEKLTDLMFAKGVSDFITELNPDADNFAARVEAARIAYNRLTATQKSYVDNYAVLEAHLAGLDKNNGKQGCSGKAATTGSVALTALLLAAALLAVKRRVLH